MSAAADRAAAWDELTRPPPPQGAWTPFRGREVISAGTGATWTPIDTISANVTLRAGDHVATVTVTVDAHGRLQEVSTQRRGNPDSGEFGLYPFGGAVEEHADFDCVTIGTVGRVGWWWGTERQADGEFRRYRITDMRRISPRAEASG